MSKLEVNAIEPEGASTTLTLGASGDTVALGSGATSEFGKVLQAVTANTTTTTVSTINGWVDTGLNTSITPSSTSSKILVLVSQPVEASRSDNEADVSCKLQSNHSGSYVDIQTVTDSGRLMSTYQSGTFSSTSTRQVFNYSTLFSPSTTSSFTVKTVMRFSSAYGTNGDIEAQQESLGSQITLLEVAG